MIKNKTNIVKGGFKRNGKFLYNSICSSSRTMHFCNLRIKKNMKYKTDTKILIFILSIYIINQTILKPTGNIFFNNYLNDLLATPLFFSLVNLFSQYNTGKQVTQLKHLIPITIILSILGEYITPLWRSNNITDNLDIICYFIGMIIYYLIKKINLEKEKNIRIEEK